VNGGLVARGNLKREGFEFPRTGYAEIMAFHVAEEGAFDETLLDAESVGVFGVELFRGGLNASDAFDTSFAVLRGVLPSICGIEERIPRMSARNIALHGLSFLVLLEPCSSVLQLSAAALHLQLALVTQ